MKSRVEDRNVGVQGNVGECQGMLGKIWECSGRFEKLWEFWYNKMPMLEDRKVKMQGMFGNVGEVGM